NRKLFYGLFLFLEFPGLFLGLFVLLGFFFFLGITAGVFLVGVGLRLGLWFILLLAFLFFFLWRLEGDGRERLAEEACADGPGHGFAAIGPGEVVGANVGDFLHWDGARVNHDGGSFAANGGHRRDVELVHDVREDPTAIGADAHVVGR